MKILKNKFCPRCNFLMPKEINVCPSCCLNFEKFMSATNKDAKKRIREGSTNQVLLRRGTPKDVKRIRLLLIAIFFGIFGGHYYYVGRYKTGILFSVFSSIAIIVAYVQSLYCNLENNDLWQFAVFLATIGVIFISLWLIDILKICINRFKVPVSHME